MIVASRIRVPVALAFASLAVLGAASRASAAPVLGFREEFPGVSVSSWGGGALLSNPGTGGYWGASDGFLLVETVGGPGNLGTVSFGSEYAGDWTAAGITQVRVWLRDVDATGNLDIHMSLGNSGNFWQHNAGFVPPIGKWAQYVVDLNGAAFTRTRGSGTFAAALQAVDRLHFRHDLAPYVANPDQVQGGFGLDHLLLTNGVLAVGSGPQVARPVLLDPPYPNPARGRVTFALSSGEGAPVSLRIFDVAGRLVRAADLSAASGPRLWLWDGRDGEGRRVPAGVYRAVASGEGGGTSRTFTILR